MKLVKTLPAVLALGVAAALPANGTEWNYQLTPYLWANGISGTQTVRGRELDVDASFGDLLEVLDVGFAARIEGRSPTWGWYGDYFYAKLSGDKNLPRATLEGETKQTIAEAGVIYRINDVLEGMGGLLYQKSEMEVGLKDIGSLDGSESWVDGLVSLRWTPVDNDKWNAWLRGGVGAGDSDLVWLATAGVGYRFNESWSALAAYRYLDTDYESDDFGWDIVQQGLGLGVGYSW
ncbi:MAG: hypothetical protein U9Q71_06240 [Pseudomonadota bacterium]|nr:hypothetical protein [Pseudomonadota bacterium]